MNPKRGRARIRPKNIFYGWWVVVASFFTLGLAVGLPYFGMPFFYDYFERPPVGGGFGWSRSAIIFGLPLGTLATLWVGPLLAHRFPPRHLILVGTGLTALTLTGFGRMNGRLWVYWILWLVYMTGNVFSGPLSHQVILAHWFHRRQGTALSIAYLGISFIGAFSARLVAQPLTEAYGFRIALQVMGGLLLLTWPFVLLVMRERPAQMGLQPDGGVAPARVDQPAQVGQTPDRPAPFAQLLRRRALWLLIVGGACFAGAIGSINQHLKLIIKESGFGDQRLLDQTFSQTLLVLLIVSAAGRLLVGWLADRLPKRRMLTMAFLLLLVSLPMLLLLTPPAVPYPFAILFGLATGADFLLVALMAADHFGVASLARVLAILLPVMTVGQTWCPYFIALLRERTGSYEVPLGVIILIAITGYVVLTALPRPPEE